MLNINTNYAAAFASNAAKKTASGLDSAMEKLSTGSRINYAKDDAAGVAIATRLTAEIEGLAVASRNAADAQSMLDTAEGGMQETHNVLLRMRELAVQSANGTLTDADRAHTNAEFSQLQAEIDRISVNTKWAGKDLLTGASFSFQVGEGAGQKIDVTIGDIDTFQPKNTLSGTTYYGVAGTSTSSSATVTVDAADYDLSADATTAAVAISNAAHGLVTGDIVVADLNASEEDATWLTDGAAYTVTRLSDTTFSLTSYDANGAGKSVINHGTADNSHAITFTKLTKTGVDSESNAQTAITAVDYAIDFVSTERGKLGAYSNRLGSTISNLDQINVNLSASKGRIEDADFAAETGNLAKNQILQQAATAMIAQANASKSSVLTLVRG